MTDKRTQVILRDLRNNLEDIITKLNTHTPQSLHDDIIPLLEDIEMLQSTDTGPSLNESKAELNKQQIIQGNNEDILKRFTQAGVNGPAAPTKPEEITLEVAIADLLDTVIRLDERLTIEAKTLPVNSPIEKIENVMAMRDLIKHISDIANWLSFVVVEAEEILEDEEEDDQRNSE